MIGSRFIQFLVIWLYPTHKPTHQTIYPAMGDEFSTDFKSSNRIELSWLVQVLLNFLLIPGVPPRWWVGGLGWGWVWVCGDAPSTMHMLACMHMHACTHTHTHRHVKNDKHGCLHVSGHLQFLYIYTCACVHVCGTPPHAPRHLMARSTPLSVLDWATNYPMIGGSLESP